MKGYKICDATYTKRIGVACSSLEELLEKGCRKLGIDYMLVDKVLVQLSDGTLVEDNAYFGTLPQNTLLVFSLPHENILTGADLMFSVLRKVNKDFLCAAEASYRFLSQDIKTKLRELMKVVEKQESSTCRYLSKKVDDPDWFKGLDTNSDTKEQVMFHRSQDRIRGYFYKTCDDLRKSSLYKENKDVRKHLTCVIDKFKKELTHVKYFGTYFDRKAEHLRLCNEDGDFLCQGLWRVDICSYSTHRINPYDSRESRILFSTWNLDHRVERSRSVVPSLLEAAVSAVRQSNEINWEYFFKLLFTTANLNDLKDEVQMLKQKAARNGSMILIMSDLKAPASTLGCLKKYEECIKPSTSLCYRNTRSVNGTGSRLRSIMLDSTANLSTLSATGCEQPLAIGLATPQATRVGTDLLELCSLSLICKWKK